MSFDEIIDFTAVFRIYILPPIPNIGKVCIIPNISKVWLILLVRGPLGTVDVGHSWHTIRYHIGEIKKRKSLHRGGMVCYHPLVGDMAEILLDRTQRRIKTLRDKCEFPEYSEEHELGHHIR